VVVALVEFAVIMLMGRTSDTPYNKVKCTTMSKKKLLRRKILAKGNDKFTDGKMLSGIQDKVDQISQALTGKYGKQEYSSRTINKIDFVSFWLFLSFFLLFNIAYWNSY